MTDFIPISNLWEATRGGKRSPHAASWPCRPIARASRDQSAVRFPAPSQLGRRSCRILCDQVSSDPCGSDAYCANPAFMKLSAWLEKTGIPVDEFADLIGVHRSTVNRFVRGFVFPRLETVEKIKEVTNGEVTAQDLIDIESSQLYRNRNNNILRSRREAKV